jgi:hypothetical protein
VAVAPQDELPGRRRPRFLLPGVRGCLPAQLVQERAPTGL